MTASLVPLIALVVIVYLWMKEVTTKAHKMFDHLGVLAHSYSNRTPQKNFNCIFISIRILCTGNVVFIKNYITCTADICTGNLLISRI